MVEEIVKLTEEVAKQNSKRITGKAWSYDKILFELNIERF